MYVLGTDIGTGSTTSIIVEIETGRIIAKSTFDYKPGFIIPKKYLNGAEQWPEIWWDAVKRTISNSIRESRCNPKDIVGVSISGLYGGSGIPVDKDMRPIRPCMIWLDQRASRECEILSKEIGEKFFGEITGNYTIHPYYGYTKLFWFMVNEPDHFKKTAKIFTPSGFCVYKLTGVHVTDYSSIGNFGGIFDIRKYEISPECLQALSKLASKITKKKLELNEELFGTLCASDKIIGEVTPDGQKSTGLRAGTPVVAGGIDAPVSLAAVGGIYAGENSLMLGTSWCWGVLQNRKGAIYPKQLISYPYVISSENLIYTFGGGAYTGGAIEPWFKTFFGGEQNLEELEKLATKVPPGCKGLIFHPFLMGERTPIWDPFATGGFMGLRAIHTKAYAFRSMLEGAAYLHKWNLEEAVKGGLKFRQNTILCDGGAKSKLWRQILADVTQKNIMYLEDFPGTPYGDALLATIGTKNGKKTIIKKWLPGYREIKYNRKFKDIYEKNYRLFKGIYYSQKNIYRKFHSPGIL